MISFIVIHIIGYINRFVFAILCQGVDIILTCTVSKLFESNSLYTYHVVPEMVISLNCSTLCDMVNTTWRVGYVPYTLMFSANLYDHLCATSVSGSPSFINTSSDWVQYLSQHHGQCQIHVDQ